MALMMPIGNLLEPGPGLFPAAICLVLAVLAAIAAYRDFPAGNVNIRLSIAINNRAVILFILGGICAALLVDIIGYPATTFLAIFLVLRILFEVSVLHSGVIAITVTAIATLIFEVLDVALPLVPSKPW